METTQEQRQAVARDECRSHGHLFQEVMVYGTLAPQRVECRNCSASWRVHPDDVASDFAGLVEPS